MVCKKCGYADSKETIFFGSPLCKICSAFAPNNIHDFQKYVDDKIDWKILDSFRNFGTLPGSRQKSGMIKKASQGIPVSRAPFGYEIIDGNLYPTEDAAKIHSLFRTFLNRNYSLQSLAKNFSLSVNGLKKVLSNRTYLGEIKFNSMIHKGHHQPLVSPEIFYAVQRKLKEQLRPRKKLLAEKFI